jgi:F0F1-type ATP synthase membrane subunit c/vacuolar-type H+-ATPase subunit K
MTGLGVDELNTIIVGDGVCVGTVGVPVGIAVGVVVTSAAGKVEGISWL